MGLPLVRWLTFTYLIFICAQSFGLDSIVLDRGPVSNFSVKEYIYLFETEDEDISIDQVRQREFVNNFMPLPNHVPSFGYSDNYFWFRFHVENLNAKELDLVLQIQSPLLDEIQFYQYNGEQLVSSYLLGDTFPFYSRPIKSRYFKLPVKLEGYALNEFYLRVHSTSSVEVPIYISSKDSYLSSSSFTSWIVGIGYGIALGLGLFNLLLGLSTREVVYLYYAGFTLSVFGIYSAIDGYSYMLWPGSVVWQQYFLLYIVFFTNIFAITFSRAFLASSGKGLRSDQFVRLLMIPCVLGLACVAIIEEKVIAIYMSLVSVVVITSLFVLGVVRFYQGYYVAKTFIIAWSLFLMVALLALISSNGYLFSIEEMKPYLRLAWTSELILLSLALGQRINMDRAIQVKAERDVKESALLAKKAKQKALEIQIQANSSLEFKVRMRTAELEKALEELSLANGKLEKLSTEDPLTKVKNRRYFEERYELEFKRSFREKQPMSILFIDVDHFKNFNDRYGHQAGDECLRQTAFIINSCVSRPGDTVCRYGGEEFVVILPDTPQTGALKVAARILNAIAGARIDAAQHKVSVTVSIGSCTDIPENAYDTESLLVGADKALYKAKDSGRNCVQTGVPRNSYMHNNQVH